MMTIPNLPATLDETLKAILLVASDRAHETSHPILGIALRHMAMMDNREISVDVHAVDMPEITYGGFYRHPAPRECRVSISFTRPTGELG